MKTTNALVKRTKIVFEKIIKQEQDQREMESITHHHISFINKL